MHVLCARKYIVYCLRGTYRQVYGWMRFQKSKKGFIFTLPAVVCGRREDKLTMVNTINGSTCSTNNNDINQIYSWPMGVRRAGCA